MTLPLWPACRWYQQHLPLCGLAGQASLAMVTGPPCLLTLRWLLSAWQQRSY